MNLNLTPLAILLEEELALGAQLGGNLAAQKDALIAWDVDRLMHEIESREGWLRQLAQLEEKRCRILGEIGAREKAPTLRQIVAALPEGSAEKSRLLGLRERLRDTFVRLQSEERHLHMLMRDLLCHIQQALRPLGEPDAPIYCETGSPEPHRSANSLLRSRA